VRSRRKWEDSIERDFKEDKGLDEIQLQEKTYQ
jgi:hypothetical protein